MIVAENVVASKEDEFHLEKSGSVARIKTMGDELLHGLILAVDPVAGTVRFRPDHGEIGTVALTEVRYLEFERACFVVPGMGEQEPANIGQAHYEYYIEFSDGELMSGLVVGAFRGTLGVHIYRAVERKVVEFFVPNQVIADYQIAPLGGKLLGRSRDQRPRKADGLPGPAHNAAELKNRLQQQPHRHREPLGEILVRADLITAPQLDEALVLLAQQDSKRLGEVLVDMGITTDRDIHRALAEKFDLPYVNLHEYEIDPTALTEVPANLCRKYGVMPLVVEKSQLVIALEDPSDNEALNILRFAVGRNVEVAVSTRDDIQWAIERYYGVQEGDELFEELAQLEEGFSGTGDENDQGEAERLGKEKPVVRLVENTVKEAIASNASDIHILPDEHGFNLLYRIDGVLVKMRSFKKKLLPAVVSRMKIISGMDISERRVPQDGQARFAYAGKDIDLRFSVIPTITGESIVIRILNAQVGARDIDSLGLSPTDERAMHQLVRKTYGMFLVTGPTGSGKSTTLYAVLKELRKLEPNIITVEDPVEYHISGVRQIQVKKDINYTFARALRHILRHDPDVIMIGEMRDQETARIAIESSLTGHFVLSTLHTNSAASTVVRLLEMGIEPYLISSSVRGIMGQRLVRVNCPHCVGNEEVDAEQRAVLNLSGDEKFVKGRGCEKCNNTGYKGRMMVYELLMVTPEIRSLIRPGVSADDLHAKAIACGMVSLNMNALAAARAGKTSLAEVLRVQLD